MEMLGIERQLKVLVIIDGESSSIHPCISLPFDYLVDQKALCYRLKNVLEVTITDIFYFDIFYFLRSADPLNAYWLSIIKEAGRKAVYEIDDNFFALQQKCFKKYYTGDRIKTTIQKFLVEADIVKYGTELLRTELSGHDRNAVVLPYPGPSLTPISCDPPDPFPAPKLIFASSAERRQDLVFLIPVLYRLLDEYENLQIEFAGFNHLEGLSHSRIRFRNYEFDADRFYGWLKQQKWNIGLAPLKDTLSNRCKTNSKYREYATYGIAGVYSKLPPYGNVEDHKTGIVVENTPELWYRAIVNLIENPDLRSGLIRNASRDIQENYSVEKISRQIVQKILIPLCECQGSFPATAREIEVYQRTVPQHQRLLRGGLKIRFKQWLEKRIGQKLYRKLRLAYLYKVRKI
jgi:glycosyltransferase involved in cell wall biosynthesis